MTGNICATTIEYCFPEELDENRLVTAMEYKIEKYLNCKDATRYGSCQLCGTKVYWTRQKVESHLRSGNCIKSELTLPNQQSNTKNSFKLTDFSKHNATGEIVSEFGAERQNEHPVMAQVKVRDYINLFQQFLYLPLFEKKQYLRRRAPDSFIQVIREGLRNVRSGIVPCDESLTRQCCNSYSYGRIDGNGVSHKEARNHLCQPRTLDVLIRVLPFVLNYLHSLLD